MEALVMARDATACRVSRMATGSILALGLALLSSELARDAVAQQQERQPREWPEETAACRIASGEAGVPAGRTTLGACARAIQAASGTGTWGPYELEVDRHGRVHVNGEDVGVMRGPGVPTGDPGRG
jgi:hypothetical protein